jgi:muramidase (phage lysozyme)
MVKPIIQFVKNNYAYILAIGSSYLIYRLFYKGDIAKIVTPKGPNKYTPSQKYPALFDVILKGEAHGYNDLNYYKGNSLKSYIQGRYGSNYGGLTKPLSEYTIAQVMQFQSQPRSSANGQLWATGLYQVIPSTLKGIYQKAGLKSTDLYSPANQDKIAVALVMERSNLKKYLTGLVADTQANLEKAALDVAMVWSSSGVPYNTLGRYQTVNKNQSYYHKSSGGGDKASVKTEKVQEALKASRKK